MSIIAQYGDVLVILACLFGFFMAWGVGANDVANAMGTSVGSKAITIKQAIIIAVIFEFLGAWLAGGEVTDTIRKGIIDPSLLIENPQFLVYGMLASLLAAGIWLLIASMKGWPVSTTHSIVGAIVGFAALLMGPAREGIAQLTVLFLLGGAAFTLYPVAVSHAADRAPAGALVRMSQGLLLINAVGSTLSPPAVSLPMAEMGAMPGMALSLAVMGGGMLLFFVWRRVMRPAPQPLAPFETHAPQTPLGTELAVGPELVEAAEEHLRDAEADDPLVEVTRELVADMPELITDASLDSLEEIEVKEEQALHDEQALNDEQSLQDAQQQVLPRDDAPLARD